MTLEHLCLSFPAGNLASVVKGAPLNKPKKKDYDPSLWKRMQHYHGANFYEDCAGCKLFYQLGFMHGKLVSVQINTQSSFSEAGYGALLAIGDAVAAANVTRLLKPDREPGAAVPWSELKDQELAASGLPNDRYFICRSESWRQDLVHSYLNIALEWPHVLALEYREETADAG